MVDGERASTASRAGGGLGTGKGFSNILCCICGRSMQPNGELGQRRSSASLEADGLASWGEGGDMLKNRV